MKTLIMFLLVFLSWFPPGHEPGSTMRCLVEPKSVKDALKRATAVFSGEVLETKSGVNFLQARFRVERSWKGVEADEVLVITDGSAESPHYRFGEKYLVFAGIRDGKFFTGMCSRTKKIEYAQGDLQQLGEGKVQKKRE
jgi:hypothetical protein